MNHNDNIYGTVNSFTANPMQEFGHDISSPTENNKGSGSNSSRKNSGDTSTPKRSRVTRACDTCRRKKIKCDVNTRNPCTTCKQYEWECTFHDTAKKRGPPKGYIESLENRLEKMEMLLRGIGNEKERPEADDISTSTKRRKRQTSSISSIATMNESGSTVMSPTGTVPDSPSSSPTQRLSKGKVFRYHGSSSGYYLVGNILSKDKEEEEEEEKEEEVYREKEKQKLFVVPSYDGSQNIRLRRVNVNDDDLMIVRDTTADEDASQLAVDEQETIDAIIPRPVLTALVNTYFADAHITLPVLDKAEYMNAFEGRTSPPPAPLLTYAICSYSCFLLKSDHPIFKEADVERDFVFQTLLDRANMLVRKEYLVPRVVTIQALILLCAHPTYSTSTYRNWILAGMAVRMAQDLGLHRTVRTVKISDDFKERRKRLWYSVYITDRWCCAVMGRPLAIADSDCDVDLPLVSGAEDKEDFVLFVNFVKLSGILGEVLRRIYSPKAKLNGYKTKAMEQTVWSLQKMLEEWFANVPSSYKITEDDLSSIQANPSLYPADSKKVSEGGPLTVCYYAVVLLLNRPFIVLDKDDNDIFLFSRATELCRKAAKAAVDTACAIPSMSIAKFGWNFAAYSVFQAALIHVYNCTSSDPVIAKEAQEYVKICTEECLSPLNKDIPAGPPMVSFLQTIYSLLKTEDDITKDDERNKQNRQNMQTNTTNDNNNTTQPQQQPQLSTASAFSLANVGQMAPNNVNPFDDVARFPIENVNSGQSWLLNGSGSAPALTQAAWQQLFSTAGTPFSAEAANRGSDVQGWDNFFMENQSNSAFMP